MTSGLWARVSALFEEVRQRPAPEREAWLRARSDDTTRAAVTGMLRAYDGDPAFDPSAAVGDTLGDVLAPALIGRRLGAYRLVAEIGRGGMGIVFAAQRDDDEFDRRAAIKILPAWSAAPVVERFRFERRVLAGLDHPGIAKLLDAGSTDDGMPYLVMELVDGQPIDSWCEAHRTGLRARVALVEKVCAALAYAHQRLVVHRDVKAANILVTAAGEPKLLDFGIATLLATDGAATSGLTQTGHHSFTPDYASPEQIRGERVTTASDVYSLGVVLYRLLAERPPYVLRGLSTLEAIRVVCEVEPPPMYTVAAPERRAVLRGDLDRIVGKALRKAPQERYGTIVELAADLRAWQEGRPVTAATQSVAYRVRRFVRRNRGKVAVAAALALTLVAGVAATAWQARVAAEERDKAQQRFRQVREMSRALIFDVHDALERVPGATEPRRLLLDRAVHFFDGLAAGAGADNALKLELAEGYRRLGLVQGSDATDNLGDTAGATASLAKATRLLDEVRRTDPDAHAALNRAIETYSDMAQVDQDAAAASRADATRLALLGELERRNPTDVESLMVLAGGYSNAGIFRAEQRALDDARRYYGDAVRIYEAIAGSDGPRPFDWVRAYTLTLKRLGAVEMVTGALADSERHYRQALALETERLEGAPANRQWRFERTYTLSDLGMLAQRQGRRDEAIRLWTEARGVRAEALDGDPRNERLPTALAVVTFRLGKAFLAGGDFGAAEPYFREEVPLRERLVAAEPGQRTRLVNLAWARVNLATALLGRAPAAGPPAAANAAAAREVFRAIDLRPIDVPPSNPAVVELLGAYRTLAGRLGLR
jgi:eukaryotic-like serine/threonine-protein kinase